MSDDRPAALDCRQAREIQHAILDEGLLEVRRRQAFEAHRDACSACRERDVELRSIQAALRALPPQPLPEAALQRVWNETLRRDRRPARRAARWGSGWRAVAAAAALAAAFLFVLERGPAPQPQPTEAQLLQAAAEARFVLHIAAQALRRAERVTVDEVLGHEVSTALRRVPIRWPEPPRPELDERKGSSRNVPDSDNDV